MNVTLGCAEVTALGFRSIKNAAGNLQASGLHWWSPYRTRVSPSVLRYQSKVQSRPCSLSPTETNPRIQGKRGDSKVALFLPNPKMARKENLSSCMHSNVLDQ